MSCKTKFVLPRHKAQRRQWYPTPVLLPGKSHGRRSLVLKGGRPPVEFEERPRDCSPGHGGKEGLHLAMTEAFRVFSRAGEPVWDFSRGMTGSSGSLSCGARDLL